MKVKARLDRRPNGDYQRIDDNEWNALCRTANLTFIQQMMVSAYCDKQIKRKISETENAIMYAVFIHTHEQYGFGRKRLLRLDREVAEIVNDAYGKQCIDANGVYQAWDGCGMEHLESRLHSFGIDIVKGGTDE